MKGTGIDLHTHSFVSDGTDSPAELLQNARKAGLSLFSLTDHDALRGCETILALRQADDPLFLTGVEFSCKDELGKYHILGYGYDPKSEAIRSVIALGHGYRVTKLRQRLQFLEEKFGFRFSDDAVERLYQLDNPGKPHLGNLMVQYGYAKSKEDAIKNYLDRARGGSNYVRPEEAIHGILGAGGIPVLAHPCYGDGGQLILDEKLVQRTERLMGFGLQGMEAYYSGFSKKLRDEVLSIAESHGLYVTAGSDYHGTNKIILLGDTGFEEAEEMPENMQKFLNKVLS